MILNSEFIFKDLALEPKVIPIDLSDCESVTKAAELALMVYGHIDILINNAGISCRGSIVQTNMEVHRQLMDVNYFGPLLLTKCKFCLVSFDEIY